LALVDGLSEADLNPDERGMLGLTRGMLLYQAGELDLSFEVAKGSLDDLRSRGRVDSIAIQLQMGLGALRGRQGRYEEAAAHQERALGMAHFVGNDTLASCIAANLAIFHGRLGQHEKQLSVAQNATTGESEVAGFVDLQLAYSMAFAHGIQGRSADARKVIVELDHRLGPHLPRWIIQPWLLWKADALMIAGYRSEAMQAAAQAILEFDLKLEASAFAGPFARWLVMTCANGGTARRAGEILNGLEENLEQFDEIDQLEILCANARLHDEPPIRQSLRIAEKLKTLPACTASQMQALGMLG
jgi:hypothetical protein